MKAQARFSLLLNILLIGFTITVGGATHTFAADAPIHIEANRMTSTEKTNSVVFTGDVDAKQGDVRIRSDEMTVFYTAQDTTAKQKDGKKPAAKQAEKKPTQQVEKLICTGNVEVTRGEWLGTAKKNALSLKRETGYTY